MSGFETKMSNAAFHGADKDPTPPGRLRHAAVSLLPLGLFVGGVLGYETLAGPAEKPRQVQAAATSPAPREGTAPAPKALKLEAPADTPSPSRPKAGSSAVQADAPLFEDNRSLLDLSRKMERAQPLSTPIVSQRRITLETGPASRASLGFARSEPLPAGAYATVRGVPANARLTHGLAVGNDIWLVDGADLALVALEMRSGVAGALDLDLNVLSADNRQIAIERIAVAVKTAMEPSPRLAASAVAPVVAPTPVPAPSAEKAAPPRDVARTLTLAADTQLAPGRGNLVKFDVSPADNLPEGAYMLLRGLPRDSALSRGVLVGPDVWLLTTAELQSFEVRLPARAAGSVKLEAKLVTRLGDMIAETSASLETGARPATAIAQAAPVVPAAVATRTTSQPAPPAATTVPVAPSPPARPNPKSKAAIAEDKVAGNPILSRGRKMLAVGNIAAARPLLERAAKEGSGEAAALLGASFDSAWLMRAGAVGIASDNATANRWYDEARRLGTGDIDKVVNTPAARGAPSVTR